MLIVFAAYLGLHLAAYVLVLRRLALFRTEKGIFFFHLVSAVAACIAATAVGFLDPEEFGFAGFVLVLSVHGIYSLSFLELWSLAQGGYSLFIMAGVVRAEAEGAQPDFSRLAAIGLAKQGERVEALERLCLVNLSSGHLSLTFQGIVVAWLLNLLRRWVDPAQPAQG